MRRFRYMLLTLFALMLWSVAEAQQTISDELIYDRVSEYVEADLNSENNSALVSKELSTIPYKHDIRITYGAPGLISWLMLVPTFGNHDYYYSFPDVIDDLRKNDGPHYVVATLGLSYSQQLKPWFSLGCKTTFAAFFCKTYDTMTGQKLYRDDAYNVSAMLDCRFSWLRREKVTMYSSAALGVMAHIERANGGYIPMADFALVGVSFGRSLYGFVEVGIGVGGSVRAGLGYRFNGKKR